MATQDTQPDGMTVLALRGLRLARAIRKRLQATGVYCQPAISIEHQHTANRYVLRGTESGGAVAEAGSYCGFAHEDGAPLPWLQPLDRIGVNGLHAIVVAPVLVRLQVFRYRQTYDLLITRHALRSTAAGARPRLDSSVIFHGRQGTLALELWGRDNGFRGLVAPVFYKRSGEEAAIPRAFVGAVCQTISGACCIGCTHSHVLIPPRVLDKAEEGPEHGQAKSQAS
jgi:hypothetical protein